MRRRGGRKRALGTGRRWRCRKDRISAGRWTSCRDTLTDGRRFRILAVVDDFTRECLCLVADTSLSGLRVARELDALIAARGRPLMCVSDNGTELTSMAILRWSQETRRRLALHRARQADAERLHRELQRPAARRAVERDAVRFARSCPHRAGDLDGRLQHRAPAQRDRQPAARRPTPSSAFPRCNGMGAALRRGLRAPSRCTTEPQAQMKNGLYPSLDETRGSGQLAKGIFQLWRYFSHARRGFVMPHVVDPDAHGIVLTLDDWVLIPQGIEDNIVESAKKLADNEGEIIEQDRRKIAFSSVADFERLLTISDEVYIFEHVGCCTGR